MRSKENQLLLSIGVGRLQIKERATLWSRTETAIQGHRTQPPGRRHLLLLDETPSPRSSESTLTSSKRALALARWPATRTELKKLEKKRMKEMFG